MRYALAIAVVAVAWAAALYVHQRQVLATVNYASATATYAHPSWEDPAAVLIALGGLAVAVAIARPRGNRVKDPHS